MWLLATALAADTPTLPSGGSAVRFDWATVGYQSALPESAAFGPDLLALGPEGAFAFWSPVDHRVVGTGPGGGITLRLDHLESLAFAPDGDLLVLAGRTVERWEGASRVATVRVPGLVPAGASLLVEGGELLGLDAFGNLHPIAALRAGRLDPLSGPPLRPPTWRVKVEGGRVLANGVEIAAPSDTLGARAIGDWLVIEAGERGAVRLREAISLDSGRVVALPLRAQAPYRAMADVAAGPDGRLGWLDPTVDGIMFRWEAP